MCSMMPPRVIQREEDLKKANYVCAAEAELKSRVSSSMAASVAD